MHNGITTVQWFIMVYTSSVYHTFTDMRNAEISDQGFKGHKSEFIPVKLEVC